MRRSTMLALAILSIFVVVSGCTTKKTTWRRNWSASESEFRKDVEACAQKARVGVYMFGNKPVAGPFDPKEQSIYDKCMKGKGYQL